MAQKDDRDARIPRTPHTPVRGVRVPVEVDPEQTPPPQQIPDEFGALSIGEKLEMLKTAATEQAAAMERVWAARDLKDQVLTIGSDVSEMTALMREFMMPAVKTLLGRVDNIERTHAAEAAREARFDHEWASALKTLEAIGSHMGRIEKDVDRVERSLDVFIKRSEEQTAQLRSSIDDHGKRIRILEDFVLTAKAKVAVVSALVGGGGAGGALLVKWLLGGG